MRAALQYVKGGCKKEGNRLLSGVCCDRTRGNGFKLREGRFRWDIRKRFFFVWLFYDVRVEQHWNRLPREVADAPSLETGKPSL